jgi:iron complex transport system ATP-binding protein
MPPNSQPEEETEEGNSSISPRVHVIAGGGSGELMMRALADSHIPFIAGALNIGDSDHTLALRLAGKVITEQPYAPISPPILELVHTSLTQAALLIICPVPIGPGNLALLKEAVAMAQRGLPVLLLTPPISDSTPALNEPEPIEGGMLLRTKMAERDYTGGEGLKLLEDLLQAGAVVVGSVKEAIEIIRKQPLL